jgi:hypothetical protein
MLKSILKPSESVAVGIGIGVVDAFIFQHAVPNLADIRTAAPQNTDVDTARRQATAECIAVNGLVSLMTRDWNVFLIGGVITVGLSYFTVHANAVYPQSGTMSAPGEAPVNTDAAAQYPLPDYSDSENEVS